MKRISWILAGLMVISASLYGQMATKYVKPNKENIRIEPNGKKIGEVFSGTQVKVLERQSNWMKVQFSGWIWEPSLVSDSTMAVGYAVRASHILLKTDVEAKQILTDLIAGADFETIAREKSVDLASGSNGGDLGKFTRGDLRPEFEDAVFRLKVGQISGVVQTNLGFHIIKRTE